MSVAPESGRNRIMIYGRRTMVLTSWSSRQPMARRWPSACRLEKPACSSISRSECPMGCSCRTLREKENSGVRKG